MKHVKFENVLYLKPGTIFIYSILTKTIFAILNVCIFTAFVCFVKYFQFLCKQLGKGVQDLTFTTAVGSFCHGIFWKVNDAEKS